MAQPVLRTSVALGFPVADVREKEAPAWWIRLKPDEVYYYWDIRDSNQTALMVTEPGESSGRGKGTQLLCINAGLIGCLTDLGPMLVRSFDYLKGSDPNASKPVKWASIASVALVGVRYHLQRGDPGSVQAMAVLDRDDRSLRVTLPDGTEYVSRGRIRPHLFFPSPRNTTFIECLRIPLHMPTFRFLFSDPASLRFETTQAKIKRAEGMIANSLKRYEHMGSASYRMPEEEWREYHGREANPMGASINTLFPHLTRGLNNDNPETEWIFTEQFVTQRISNTNGRPRRGISGVVPSHRAIQMAATIHFLGAFLEGAGGARDPTLSDMVKHHVTMIALAASFGEPHAGIWIALSTTKASNSPPSSSPSHAAYWSNGAENQLLQRLDAQRIGVDQAQLRISIFDSARKQLVHLSVREALLTHGFVAGSAAFMMHDAPLFLGLMLRDENVTEFDAMLGLHFPESITSILRIIPHVCLTDDRTRAPGAETLMPYICDPYSDATPLPRMQGWRALLRKIMALVVSEGPTRIKGGTYVLPLKVSARDIRRPLVDLGGIFPLYPNYSSEKDSNQLLVSDGPFAGSGLRVIKWRTFLTSEIIEHVFRRHVSFNGAPTRNMQTIIKFAQDGFNEVAALCIENGCVHTSLAWLQWIVNHRGAEMAQHIVFGAFVQHLRSLGALLRSQGIQTEASFADPLASELRKLIGTPLSDYIGAQRISGDTLTVNQIVENPTLGLIETVAQWVGPVPRLITAVLVQNVNRPGFGVHPKLIIDRLEAMKMPVSAQIDFDHRHHRFPELPSGGSSAELSAAEAEMLRVCTHWVTAVRSHIDILNEMIAESRQRMPPGATLPVQRINHIGDLLDIRMDLMVGTWRDRKSMLVSGVPPPMDTSMDGGLSLSWATIFSGALLGSPFVTAEREVFTVRDYERLYMPANAPGFELSESQKKLWEEARNALNKAGRYGIKFYMNWLEMVSHEHELWTPPIWFTAIPYDRHLYFFLELLEVGTTLSATTRESWLKNLTADERRRVVSVVDDPTLLTRELNPLVKAVMEGFLERCKKFASQVSGVSREDTIQQIRCWRNPLNRLLLLALANKRMTLARRVLEIQAAMDHPNTIGGVTGHIDDRTYELGVTSVDSLAGRAPRVQDATFTASMLSGAPHSLLTSETDAVQNRPGTLAVMTALQARNGTMLHDILAQHAFNRVYLYHAQQHTAMPEVSANVDENLFPARVLSTYELASTWLLWDAPISPPALIAPNVEAREANSEEEEEEEEESARSSSGDDEEGSQEESDESSGPELSASERAEKSIDKFVMAQLTTAVDMESSLTQVAAGALAPTSITSVAKPVADVNLYRASAATAKTRPVSPSLIQGLVNHAQLAALPLRARNEEINARLARDHPMVPEKSIHEAMHMAQAEARSVCARKQEDWAKYFNTRLNNLSTPASWFHAKDAMLPRIIFDATRLTREMIPPDLARLAILHAPIAERMKLTMAHYVSVLESVPSAHDEQVAAQSVEEMSRASEHMEIAHDNVPATDAAAMTTREARETTNARLAVEDATRRAVGILPQWLEEEAGAGPPPALTFPTIPASDEPEEEDIRLLERADIPNGTEIPNPLELAAMGGGRGFAREEELLLHRATAMRVHQNRELHTSSIEALIAAATPLVMCALCGNRITRFCDWLGNGATMNELPNDPWLQSILPVQEDADDTSAPSPVQGFFQSTFFWTAWEWALRLFAPLNLDDRVKRAISQFVLSTLMMPYREPILTETDLLRYTANDPQLHGAMHENVVELSKQMHKTTADPATQDWLSRAIYWGDPREITKTERRWKASHHRVSTFTLEKLAPTDASRPWATVTPFVINSTRRLLTNLSRRYHATTAADATAAVGVYQEKALMTTVRRINATAATKIVEISDTFITVATPYLVRNYWTAQFNGRSPMASLMSTLGEGDPSHAELVNIFTQLLTRFVPRKMLAALTTAANYPGGRLDMHDPFDASTVTALATVLSDMATVRNTFFDAGATPPWYAVPACTTPDRTAEVQILAYILFGIQPLGNDANQFKRAMLEFKRRYHDLLRQHKGELTDVMDTTL